jgi:hypothetical protein
MFFLFDLNLSKFFLSLIMGNQFKITFSIKNKSLSFCLFILIDFFSPLFFEHCLFFHFLFYFISCILLSSICLPSQDINSFLYLLSLISSFALFSFNFFLLIKHPKFSIYLFFNNVLFNFVFLVHQLFFSFDLTTSNHKVSFLFSQFVSFHFEFTIKSLLNKSLSLLFPAFFKCC